MTPRETLLSRVLLQTSADAGERASEYGTIAMRMLAASAADSVGSHADADSEACAPEGRVRPAEPCFRPEQPVTCHQTLAQTRFKHGSAASAQQSSLAAGHCMQRCAPLAAHRRHHEDGVSTR